MRLLTFFHLESLFDDLILSLFVLYAPFLMMKSPESLVTMHVLQVGPEVTYGLFAFPTLQQILRGEFLVPRDYSS